ncbi:hypothetical protein T492DRAFT_938066 [Pavlovales sp. CCMP2436]|nr:hypothetical protein T492DRAFT_938066 [Pavlovales sp. CCMP2436]
MLLSLALLLGVEGFLAARGGALLSRAALPRTHIRSAEAKVLAEFERDDFGPWLYSPRDFRRIDESLDFDFYSTPRFVTHIDDGAIASLTEYYRRTLPADGAILDLCSSWISHLPAEVSYGSVAGIGMNYRELEANKRLTAFSAQDLNFNATLPYPDATFDCVVNAVSVDYMTKPLPLFKEMHRVLKPGGRAIMSFSNRCFPTKAVGCWLDADETGRLAIVANYFHHSASWEGIRALDIIPLKGEGMSRMKSNPAQSFMASWASMDPMYIVEAWAVK